MTTPHNPTPGPNQLPRPGPGPSGQYPPPQRPGPYWQAPTGNGPGNEWQRLWQAPAAQQWPSQAAPQQQRPGTATGNPKKRHWAVPVAAVAALVVAAGAGAGIGHIAWPGAQSVASGPIAMRGESPGPGANNGAGQENSPNGSGGSGGSGGPNSSYGSNSPDGSNSLGGSNNPGNAPGNNNGNSNGSGNTGDGGTLVWPPLLIPNGLVPGGGVSPQGTNPGAASSSPGAPPHVGAIAEKVDSAVVDINVRFKYQQAAGAGTGIVLTATGEVLTNNHVIDGATSISVTDIGNGKTYGASIVGYDPSDDIAVLQLKGASGLTTATINSSSALKRGDAVVGIGNAGGVGGIPSAAGGSVAALNKSISVGDEMYGTTEHLSGLIETNADIQAGDSGGPLVDKSGAVVGVDTAASAGPAATMQGQGHQGFAIPIKTALSIAHVIESGHGTASVHVGPTAALGVLVTDSNRSLPGQQLPAAPGNGDTGAQGAIVAGVIAGGAGAQAGLQAGDVITSVGDQQMSSASALSRQMLKYNPGQTVSVGWSDANGGSDHATVTLGTGPPA